MEDEIAALEIAAREGDERALQELNLLALLRATIGERLAVFVAA